MSLPKEEVNPDIKIKDIVEAKKKSKETDVKNKSLREQYMEVKKKSKETAVKKKSLREQYMEAKKKK